MRRDITTNLRKTSMLLPYVAEWKYDAQPDFVLELFINRLNNQGAHILCWDKKAGVVCWYDTGGSFVPLPAMPNKLNTSNELDTYGMVQGKVTFWRGYVYGCSHIVSSGDGAWLTMRTIGRDVTSGRRVFSDGSYERRLIGTIKRKIQRFATGQLMIPEFQEPKPKYSSRTSVNYEELFRTQFKNFPKINSIDIMKKNKGERYPVSADRIWRTCLDVITQYALVPYLNSGEKVIVFSRRLPVPIDINTKAIKLVDVIMAVTIQPDSEDPETSCMMYTSLLGEDDLHFNVIKGKLPSGNQGESEVDLSGPQIETAAVISRNDLARQVYAQLLYNENLGNKLLRRLSK